MTEVYAAAVAHCDTEVLFSTFEKAKAACEAKILKWHRGGQFGIELTQGPPPEITWYFHEADRCWHLRARFSPTYTWEARRIIHAIQLDPEEI